jgi:hypothetical protein
VFVAAVVATEEAVRILAVVVAAFAAAAIAAPLFEQVKQVETRVKSTS